MMKKALIASLAVFAIYTSQLQAQTIQRPTGVNGGPTKVYVAMGLLDVDEIDSAGQSFTANLFVSLRWHDPRLAHEGPGERVLKLNKVWHPEMLFVNQQKIWPSLPEVVRIAPNGDAEYNQRVWGPFSQPLNLREFPFDTQDFEIRIASAGSRPDEIDFVPDPDTVSGIAPAFSLPDWEILNWSLDFSPYEPVGSRRGSASFAMIMIARRYVSHYLLKIILPLVLIVAMSWIVFWIDPEEAGTQIGVATTSMLTLIAYRFMVGGQVPVVPYLTRMDYFILGSTILVFLALMQSVLTSIMAHHEKLKSARRLDCCCRVIFPSAFGLVLYLSLLR
jgi:hypothetical protein